MSTATAVDHRSRVAAERRERTRKRLLESAMIVYAQKGMTSSVIQDVVAEAKVSQGSFYNYFKTNEALFVALATEFSNELIHMIEPVIGEIEHPAMKIATAIRTYLHMLRSCPVATRFIAKAGLRLMTRANSLEVFLPRDLKTGQQQGIFTAIPVRLAMQMISGTGLMVIGGMVTGETPEDAPEQVAEMILRALGVPPGDAGRFVECPLVQIKIPEDSLLARAQARFQTGNALTTDTV
jgi:AcrR family transcriptional regulator